MINVSGIGSVGTMIAGLGNRASKTIVPPLPVAGGLALKSPEKMES
jgi:hypothetical protein